VYPDEEVASFVSENFIPVRIHVKEQPQNFERFGAQWTPTIQLRDSEGNERHKIEGFLPKNEFLAQLRLGLAHAAFARNEFEDAERRFREVAQSNDDDTAPEATYWAGVARYKHTNDPRALGETHKALSDKWANSSWAKKASVWGG
jgi:TolA-binding protein